MIVGQRKFQVALCLGLLLLVSSPQNAEARRRMMRGGFRNGFVSRNNFFNPFNSFNNFGFARVNVNDLLLPTFLQGSGKNFPIGLTPLSDRLAFDAFGRVFELNRGALAGIAFGSGALDINQAVRQEIVLGRNGNLLFGRNGRVDAGTLAQIQAFNSGVDGIFQGNPFGGAFGGGGFGFGGGFGGGFNQFGFDPVVSLRRCRGRCL